MCGGADVASMCVAPPPNAKRLCLCRSLEACWEVVNRPPALYWALGDQHPPLVIKMVSCPCLACPSHAVATSNTQGSRWAGEGCQHGSTKGQNDTSDPSCRSRVLQDFPEKWAKTIELCHVQGAREVSGDSWRATCSRLFAMYLSVRLLLCAAACNSAEKTCRIWCRASR